MENPQNKLLTGVIIHSTDYGYHISGEGGIFALEEDDLRNLAIVQYRVRNIGDLRDKKVEFFASQRKNSQGVFYAEMVYPLGSRSRFRELFLMGYKILRRLGL